MTDREKDIILTMIQCALHGVAYCNPLYPSQQADGEELVALLEKVRKM